MLDQSGTNQAASWPQKRKSSQKRRKQWHPTPVLLPGESHGQSLWRATVHGITKSRTRLGNWTTTTTRHFHSPELCFLGIHIDMRVLSLMILSLIFFTHTQNLVHKALWINLNKPSFQTHMETCNNNFFTQTKNQNYTSDILGLHLVKLEVNH